ncbi:hypothetical protein AMELA_G00155630 [Ameiurus melas]|uniref:Uncharacterized protein n=1 Tax=Ameiurus melas TaxID=219545 RepID=A0A7J6ADV2_AMEME|nr:hypothetical protein AMELA_G00155630 [Ameiurus melas]
MQRRHAVRSDSYKSLIPLHVAGTPLKPSPLLVRFVRVRSERAGRCRSSGSHADCSGVTHGLAGWLKGLPERARRWWTR